MNSATSLNERFVAGYPYSLKRALTALEVLLVYAGILTYIWRWQYTHPRIWVLLLIAVLASHVVRSEGPRALGLAGTELRANAQVTLPLVLLVYVPLVILGFARHTLVLTPLTKSSLASFASYGSWCVFQQYLTQSYFHRRLLTVFRNPHVSSLLIGLMFGSAHIPNPVLIVVTAIGGFILAELFARHPNIWPLALAQAVGGFLVAALTPASLIHNMRVGPGYFFYRVR
jgi:hypothetical protein